MERIIFVETGVGIDTHGQNVTKAAVRAVENAIHYNSMPGLKEYLPEKSLHNMKVHVKLAVPADKELIDILAIQAEIPYGIVTVEVVDGGMITTSGILLEEQHDQSDLMYIVNAAVEVGY